MRNDAAVNEDEPRPKRRRRVAIGVVMVVVVVAAAIVVMTRGGGDNTSASGANGPGPVPPGGPAVTFSPRPCPGDVARDIANATCGMLIVPEDPKHTDNGRRVQLQVVRAPARDGSTSTPVVDLGVDSLATSPLRDHTPMIRVSRRGFAPSLPVLQCPDYSAIAAAELRRPVNALLTRRLGTKALFACRSTLEKQGIDPDAYSYAADANDLVDLVHALRLHTVHIAAAGTDAVVALAAARALPGVVRSLTLENPVPPGHSWYGDPTRYLADAFARFEALCAKDAACTAYGDLRVAYDQRYDAYRAAPTLARGVDRHGTIATVRIDGDRLGVALGAALDAPSGYGNIPLMLTAQGAPERHRRIANLVMAAEEASLTPGYAWGAALSRLCSYDAFAIDAAHAQSVESQPSFSGVDAEQVGTLQWRCEAWRSPRADDAVWSDKPLPTVPALVIDGGLDRGRELDWTAGFVDRTLPRAQVLTFASLGPGAAASTHPACLGAIRQRFLAAPSHVSNTKACSAQTPPIEFTPPPSP